MPRQPKVSTHRPPRAQVTVETARRICALTAREDAGVCHQNLVEVMRAVTGREAVIVQDLMLRAASLHRDLSFYYADFAMQRTA